MKIVAIVVVLGLALLAWRFAFAAPLPKIGSAAPDFQLPDANGKLLQLQDYRGKWLVLYFYPKNDTPGCTKEACSL
jgi:peroxiredoxin Q/BCP